MTLLIYLLPIIIFLLAIRITPTFKKRKWLIVLLFAVIYLIHFFTVASRPGMSGMAVFGLFHVYLKLAIVLLSVSIIVKAIHHFKRK